MADINQLSSTDTLNAGDLVPVWKTNNGDTRKTSMTTLQAYMQANLTFPTVTGVSQFVVQYASPAATGFTVTMTSNSDNRWLILSPLASYAAGTIVFPATANLVDNQEIIITSTQAVTALTLNGNGSSIIGTTTSIAQYGVISYKYNALGNAWYRLTESFPSITAFGQSLLDDVDAAAGRTTLGLGGITAFGFSLIDDADAAAGRTTLGLGTMSTQADSAVSITGGTITGITDLAIADGGTGASTAAGAATALGLGTGDSPQFAAINLGNASDTTITRTSAGVISVEGKAVGMLSQKQVWTARQNFSSGLVFKTETAAAIAAIGNAVNTTDKDQGMAIFDTTNNRLMIASGSNANSPWYVADGSTSVTPS